MIFRPSYKMFALKVSWRCRSLISQKATADKICQIQFSFQKAFSFCLPVSEINDPLLKIKRLSNCNSATVAIIGVQCTNKSLSLSELTTLNHHCHWQNQ